jgi:nicotinamide riboside kinase
VRDSGHGLHEEFCRVLEEFKAPHRTIYGSWELRFERAVEAIEEALTRAHPFA